MNQPNKANKPVNIEDKFSLFSAHWTPKVIAQMNDYQFKLAKLKGEFVWHQHDDTDEVFIVFKGHLRILLRNETIELGPGEMYTVLKGVEHKPVAEEECHVMLVEPRGVINTGDAKCADAAPNDVWI